MKKNYKELSNFLSKKLSQSYENIGLGSGINLFRISDPGVTTGSQIQIRNIGNNTGLLRLFYLQRPLMDRGLIFTGFSSELPGDVILDSLQGKLGNGKEF